MTLLEYWKVFRERWILVVACMLALAGVTWLITPANTDTTRRVGSYTATSTLLVGQRASEDDAYRPAVSLGRVKLFVTTGEIPVRAAEAVGYRGNPAVLASGLLVEEVSEAQAITISAVASDGGQAANVANTFARETVRYFDEAHTGTDNARLTVLQEASPIPNVEGRPILAIPSARLPRTGIAAILGLLLGFGIALVLDRLDSRLRTRREVHDALRMPVIALVPRLKRSQRVPGKLSVVSSPLGEYANGYRAARTALMHLPRQQLTGEWAPERSSGAEAGPNLDPARVILVTSAFASEGKTTSTANLAASFAETGQSVLVLDCDLRSPDVHNQFDVPQGAGISDHLVQAASDTIQPLIRPTSVNGVYLMTAGTRLDHPVALASRLEPIIREARQLADVVIVDTAPLLAASDVFDVLPLVDTVLLVVRSGRLTEQAGNRVAELLGRFKVPVTGAILLGAPARRAEGYGTRYGYGYGYGYGEERRKKEAKASRARSRSTTMPVEAEPPTESRPAAERSAPSGNSSAFRA